MSLCIEYAYINVPLGCGFFETGYKVLLVFTVNAGDQHSNSFAAHLLLPLRVSGKYIRSHNIFYYTGKVQKAQYNYTNMLYPVNAM